MNAGEKHARAVRLFTAGEKSDALGLLREVLGEQDNSEVWSDWAAVQFSLNAASEAEKGFRLALQLDQENLQAAGNLGVLLASAGRFAEARPFLMKSLGSANAIEGAAAQAWLSRMPPPGATDSAAEVEEYLRKFLSDSVNERSYFETHVHRYIATLQQLPRGTPAMRLLELGAAFHHLTPALQKFSGYGEVRCTDIWTGAPQETRVIAAQNGGESFSFVVDNFDLQRQPWPYRDAEFDAVLCCEILEHLHTDPMGLLAEINRVLKPGGVLLLTTPNLASAHAVAETMRGGSPYGYGKFEVGGRATDRHNREYTVGEVARMGLAGGFRISEVRTFDFYWPGKREIFRFLAAQGLPIAGRGDSTFLCARKHSAVINRYPEELYTSVGVQAVRREQQSGGETSVDMVEPAELPSRILLIHERLPHHDCSGADLRLFELVRELRGQSHRVTFLAREDRDADRYRPPLEALGATVYAGDSERMRHAGSTGTETLDVAGILRHGKFDLAIVSHWFWSDISVAEQYIDEIRRYSPATRVLVLSEDRHGERERRSALLTGYFSDLERAADFEQREVEIYSRADLVLYVTETDQRRFLELIPGLATEHLPIIAETAQTGPAPDFHARQGVLFLGDFDNLANRDALAWLLQTVWPQVRCAEPGITLYVAGNSAPADLPARYEGVTCIGRVADLGAEFALRRVFAAPIRYGTGIITKNMHALSHGLPVVTTPIGAEGMQLRDGEHAMIADRPEAFAAAILRLYREPQLWDKMAKSGEAYIAEKFSLAQLQSQIRKIVARAVNIKPQRADSSYQWSYRKVETACPAVLVQEPSHYRSLLRILAYWQTGKGLLEEGKPREALEQFRHIFTLVRGPLPDCVFYHALLRDMAESYRALGEETAAVRCDQEHAKCAWTGKTRAPELPEEHKMKRRESAAAPEISVVLPTYNRGDVLRLCLAALAFQSLPAERWEAVVVDDGATDDTAAICRERFPFHLRYAAQANRGAGAARQKGVELARGELLLLCNDDTMATSHLLVEHLDLHRRRGQEKIAVLGEFRHSRDANQRALSLFVSTTSFFFPQSTLKTDESYDQAYFATCNLSVRRDAVLAAGNFDPQFRVAEDTELGARLVRRGWRVIYHPPAVAVHEHAHFSSGDLLRRAQAYGAANWALFAKHPALLGQGAGPFGRLTPQDQVRIETQVQQYRAAVADGLAALQALDQLDFRLLFRDQANGRHAAEELMRKVAQIVPIVYWHYLFQEFLAQWRAARPVSSASDPPHAFSLPETSQARTA
jgi:GT2 family glycosyltransferase/SAM-dependent methyltransferase